MRWIMIAGFILFTCFSFDLVNQLDMEHYAATGRPIFGFSVDPPIRANEIPFVGSEAGYNSTVSDFATAPEQPTGFSLNMLFASAVFLWKAGWILISALGNSTITFFWWIQNFGRADVQFLTQGQAATITVIVYLVYLIGYLQWFANRSVRQGG